GIAGYHAIGEGLPRIIGDHRSENQRVVGAADAAEFGFERAIVATAVGANRAEDTLVEPGEIVLWQRLARWVRRAVLQLREGVLLLLAGHEDQQQRGGGVDRGAHVTSGRRDFDCRSR